MERFTRVDEDTIDYQFTVHDDSTFTRPWTASLPMTALGGNLYEYACHEGNYAIANMLSRRPRQGGGGGRLQVTCAAGIMVNPPRS